MKIRRIYGTSLIGSCQDCGKLFEDYLKSSLSSLLDEVEKDLLVAISLRLRDYGPGLEFTTSQIIREQIHKIKEDNPL